LITFDLLLNPRTFHGDSTRVSFASFTLDGRLRQT